MKRFAAVLATGVACLIAAAPAHAALTVNTQYYGSYGISTGGCGTTGSSCTFRSIIPAGSTIVSAFLYSSLSSTSVVPTGTLNGTTVNYATALGANGTLQAYRADVTSIVAAAYGAGNTSFTVTEGSSYYQDGEALAVIFANALLPTQTVAILDGYSLSSGDTTTINFSQPLNPTAAGFVADFRIGDGYSYDGDACTSSGQVSTISVNGTAISTVAGCNDDSIDATAANGNLITVGSDTDPFTPANPTTAQDHERYNLTPYLKTGDTSIKVNTTNASGDDNIFLATLVVSGVAAVNMPAPPVTPSVPEPATWAMMLVGFGATGVALRRRQKVATRVGYAA